MRIRPWPLVILALLHIIAPVGNLSVSCFLSKTNPVDYVRSFNSVWDAAAFFLIFPAAGVAIYFMKKWSYPVFLLSLSWSFFLNYDTWVHYPQLFPLPLLILIYLVNIGVVGYFLIPAVREVYFNPRLRWWESKPRYRLGVNSHIYRADGSRFDCEVGNISEGGVFLATSQGALQADEDIRLEFGFHKLEFNLPAKVMHIGTVDGRMGCGVQFAALNPQQKRLVRNVVRALDLLGAERRPAREKKWLSFKEWFRELLQTGKGWIPNVPRATKD